MYYTVRTSSQWNNLSKVIYTKTECKYLADSFEPKETLDHDDGEEKIVETRTR